MMTTLRLFRIALFFELCVGGGGEIAQKGKRERERERKRERERERERERGGLEKKKEEEEEAKGKVRKRKMPHRIASALTEKYVLPTRSEMDVMTPATGEW